VIRVVTGLLLPGGGDVKFLGESMAGHSPDSRVQMGTGYLKQTKNVFPGLTVVENLQLAGESVVAAGGVEARISELMTVFPILAAAREKRAGLLSGGQRQSLAVAMVLRGGPSDQ
jgi:branched-chain amino acid transport system ATP-binding protein